MNTYRDPTAWTAIAHVMREDKRRKPDPLPKHGDTAFYIARKGAGGGKHIKFNKAEITYSRLLKQVRELWQAR